MPSTELPAPPLPTVRPRRLRRTAALRDAVAETTVCRRHLMAPAFVLDADRGEQPIAAMPGVARLGIEPLVRHVEALLEAGIDKVLLFGVPNDADKDERASAATREDGVVPRALRALRARFGTDVLLATDVCLCAYMHHGHCGVLTEGRIVNDASLPLLAQMALRHAEAGADVVAPSDMMDGRVAALRQALDAGGHHEALLLSYSVKYASAHYGPFREAAGSAPLAGDRRSYQMDPRNRREAVAEALQDVAEGADWLMVKPALAFLDIIADVRAHTRAPLACYNVSGEYSMVKFAAQAGAIDEAGVVREQLLAMRRAGADTLITYHALAAARGKWLDG